MLAQGDNHRGEGTSVRAQKRGHKGESAEILWLPFMLSSLSHHAKHGSNTGAGKTA